MKYKIIMILSWVVLCTILILHAIIHDWSVWLLLTAIAVIILSCVIIPNWNTGHVFHTIRFRDLPSKEKEYFILYPILLGMGMALLLGSWGKKLIPVGAILLLLSGFMMRRIRKNLPPEE